MANIYSLIEDIDTFNINEDLSIFFDNIDFLTDYIITCKMYQYIEVICQKIDFDVDVSGYNEILIGRVDKIYESAPRDVIKYILPLVVTKSETSLEMKRLLENLFWEDQNVLIVKEFLCECDELFIIKTKSVLKRLNSELLEEEKATKQPIKCRKNIELALSTI
jgi:hypothetical protein